PAGEMFGKVMSISDDLMWRYYELLTDLGVSEIDALEAKCESGAENPRNVKVDLAKLIIRDFHSTEAAAEAEEEFVKRFVQKEIPDEIEEASIAGGIYKLPELLAEIGLAASKGEARRLIEQGGVKVNGEKVSAANSEIDITTGGVLLQVGKRKFLKVMPK
ncbi:MAG: S4 domain-containing protein, partial [Pyrinomonadaceae bacterium]